MILNGALHRGMPQRTVKNIEKNRKKGKWMDFYWTEIVPVIHPGVTIACAHPEGPEPQSA